MIEVVDNFNSLNYKNTKFIELISKKEKDIVRDVLQIKFKKYNEKSQNNTFFSFFKDQEKIDSSSEDDLIFLINKDANDKYLAKTGNYVGKFVWDGLSIEIKSRFSNVFLSRMLNFANDIYLDDVNVAGDKAKDLDISKFIIYYLFIQILEKAFLLGLPKAYKSIKHHDIKLRGKIDINRFIKHDIPFKGKISSVSRKQKEIQEILDVLHKAVGIIEHSKFSTKHISHIKTHLKQNRSKNFVSNQTINKALNSKALQNPIFAPYRKVLKYAKFIINGSNIEESAKDNKDNHGFLINVAELFEIYVSKLLAKEFPDWAVGSPKIDLYNEPKKFYSRKIIPDIVMTQGKDVMVFDTKYKRMKFHGKNQYGAGDVDRSDFFQINTYMSYYQNKPDKHKLIVGGLLYPMEGGFKKDDCHSESWFGNTETLFIVDGIDLSILDSLNSKDKQMNDIKTSEENFISRIKNLMVIK